MLEVGESREEGNLNKDLETEDPTSLPHSMLVVEDIGDSKEEELLLEETLRSKRKRMGTLT